MHKNVIKNKDDGSYSCECGAFIDEFDLKCHHCKSELAWDAKIIKPKELDPNGADPHIGGAKLDAGKNRMGLVLNSFALALLEVGKVGTYGATKYTDNGWEEVPDGLARYTDAMLRHHFAFASGEINDKDTKLVHLSHTCWNALAVLELYLRNKEDNLTCKIKTTENAIADAEK